MVTAAARVARAEKVVAVAAAEEAAAVMVLVEKAVAVVAAAVAAAAAGQRVARPGKVESGRSRKICKRANRRRCSPGRPPTRTPGR